MHSVFRLTKNPCNKYLQLDFIIWLLVLFKPPETPIN
jgi:hypothetical protein